MSRRMVVHFTNDDVRNKPQPWPVGLDEEPVPGYPEHTRWVVSSGLGTDDGAILIGFGPLGEQHVSVLPEPAVEDPSTVVGLAPTFSKDGGFFEWAIPVSEMAVREG